MLKKPHDLLPYLGEAALIPIGCDVGLVGLTSSGPIIGIPNPAFDPHKLEDKLEGAGPLSLYLINYSAFNATRRDAVVTLLSRDSAVPDTAMIARELVACGKDQRVLSAVFSRLDAAFRSAMNLCERSRG